LYRENVNFPIRLFNLTGGTDYVLVIYLAGRIGPDRVDFLEKMARSLNGLQGVTVRTVVISSSEAAIPEVVDATVLRDHDKAFFSAYAPGDNSVLLIRPDGYIGYHGRPITEERIREYLRNVSLRSTAQVSGAPSS
jgi:hypothetical protein